MQETTIPQAESEVPPSKEGKQKSKSLLPIKTEGKDGRKEGGREAHSPDKFQAACRRAECLWRSQVQLKFPAEMNTLFWLLSDSGIKISDYFTCYGPSIFICSF